MGNSTFNEEFIGKLPELEEVSKHFSAMICKVQNKPSLNPNKLEESRKIEAIIKKLFGFKSVNMYWEPYYDSNATTLVVDIYIAAGERIDKLLARSNRNGFYDIDHSCAVYILMSYGLLTTRFNLTGDELTATLLHEIGHNTDEYPYFRMGLLAKKYIKELEEKGVVVDSKYHNSEKKIYFSDTKRELNKVYRNQKKWEETTEAVSKAWANGSSELDTVDTIVEIMCNLPKTLCAAVFYPVSSVYKLSTRKSEQWADSFAVAYGYGPELFSAFRKMDEAFDDFTRLNHNKLVVNFLYAEIDLYTLLTDEHGSDQTRCKDSIIKLKSDLKNGDYPPKMKESLNEQIALLEKEYDMIINCHPQKRICIVRGFRKICDKIFGGRFDFTKLFGRHQM